MGEGGVKGVHSGNPPPHTWKWPIFLLCGFQGGFQTLTGARAPLKREENVCPPHRQIPEGVTLRLIWKNWYKKNFSVLTPPLTPTSYEWYNHNSTLSYDKFLIDALLFSSAFIEKSVKNVINLILQQQKHITYFEIRTTK